MTEGKYTLEKNSLPDDTLIAKTENGTNEPFLTDGAIGTHRTHDSQSNENPPQHPDGILLSDPKRKTLHRPQSVEMSTHSQVLKSVEPQS